MTPTGNWRYSILRMYWDGELQPSVEVPVGDFFASGWGDYAQLTSLAVCVNPGSAFNCYWEMPFRKSAKLTMTNLADTDMVLYYQIDYSLMDVPADAGYFHAQFRRVNPLPYKTDYTILDGVKGWGHYVGHVPGLGRPQHRLVGRGRDQVLHGRRHDVSRRSAARAPRTTSAGRTTSRTRRRKPVSGVLDAVRRACTSAASPTGSTSRSSGSACTGGTCAIRSASSRTCA